jgi:hypothetical protein
MELHQDLGYIFRKVKGYIDQGYSWHYSVALAGIKKHRLKLLLKTCPELKQLHDKYYTHRNANLKWP